MSESRIGELVVTAVLLVGGVLAALLLEAGRVVAEPPRVPPRVAEACTAIAEILSKLPDVKLERFDGEFDDFVKGRRHFGCQLKASGHFHDLVRAKSPEESVFELLAGKGWRRDSRYDADGPDGTAFAMRRDDLLCLVQGSWDGGDDSDPSYVPGDWYRTKVGCTMDETDAA